MPKQLGEHFESLTELEKKIPGNPRRSTYGSNYQISTIGEVCSVGDGAHAKVVRHDSGILYLTSKNIGFGNLDLDEVDFISEEDYNKLFSENSRAIRRPMPGDVLIGIIGTFGNAYQYKRTDHFGVSSSVAILRPNQSVLDPTFLYYVVSSSSFKQAHYAYKGGSVQGYTNIPTIKYLPIPLPTINEQKGIAHILGTLDDKIELNRQMNKTLEAMAHALFKSWFADFDPVYAKTESRQTYGLDAETDALFPDSFEDSQMGKIPKGWRVGTAKECCIRVENGGTPSRRESSYWEPGTILWLTSGEVRQSIVTSTENFISEEGLVHSSAKRLPKGTTVVALYGATAGQVCFLAEEMCANQACCGLVPDENMRFYIYLHFSSSVEALERQARGSAQQNLSQQIVADFPILVADPATLGRFDEVVSPLFEEWIANLHQSRTLATIRDVLLPKLLSGKIRVRDAEKLVEVAT